MKANKYGELLQEVAADLEKLEKDVEGLRALYKFLRKKAGLVERERLGPPIANGSEAKPLAGVKQIEAAVMVLREAGQPLKTRDVARGMIEGGFPSNDPARLKTSLFTTMTRRTDMFAKAGPGLWTLAKAGSH
ncbi:MAG: HTH domain-containing protein [Thermoguttaceae bacterium]|jgi:hypothetical protein